MITSSESKTIDNKPTILFSYVLEKQIVHYVKMIAIAYTDDGTKTACFEKSSLVSNLENKLDCKLVGTTLDVFAVKEEITMDCYMVISQNILQIIGIGLDKVNVNWKVSFEKVL